MSEENALEETRDAATQSEKGRSRTRRPQPSIPPPVESINVLARALSVPLEGALTASMEVFWWRLNARLASLAPQVTGGRSGTKSREAPPRSMDTPGSSGSGSGWMLGGEWLDVGNREGKGCVGWSN